MLSIYLSQSYAVCCHQPSVVHVCPVSVSCHVFVLNDPAAPEIYTLSLHDALPIFSIGKAGDTRIIHWDEVHIGQSGDRKSTRLNSSHVASSYAVFCLKEKTSQDDDDNEPRDTGRQTRDSLGRGAGVDAPWRIASQT